MVGKGLFVIPPQLKLTFITIIVTLGPCLFQIIYNNKNFQENQLEFENDLSKNFVAIDITFGLLTAISIILLLMAAGTEPGIIPRHVDVLMESIPPAYREMAEKQENRRRFQINKKQLIENQSKAMAKKN